MERKSRWMERGFVLREWKLISRSFRASRVVALGKAALPMARAVEEVAAPQFSVSGIVVALSTPHRMTPPDLNYFWRGILLRRRKVLRWLERFEDCLRSAMRRRGVVLISGGGSALVEVPLDPAIILRMCRR